MYLSSASNPASRNDLASLPPPIIHARFNPAAAIYSTTFLAQGLDQFGNDITVSVEWDANGGAIDTNGIYLASGGSGTFVVTATDQVSGLTGEAVRFVDVSEGTEDETDIPTGFTLAQNYPNPFHPITTIEYSVPGQFIETRRMVLLK